MTFQIQKKSLFKAKKRYSLVPNIWYFRKRKSKATKKVFFQKKVFFREIGRKLSFFRVQKRVFPFPESLFSFSLNISSQMKTKKNSFQTLENQKKRKTNRFWFFQTAAPIPGVSFSKKKKNFTRDNVLSFGVFRRFFASFQKKQRIQRLLSLSKNHKKRKTPKNWRFLVLRNSLNSRTLRQAIFVKNAQARPDVEKFLNLNGKKRKSQSFPRLQSPKAFGKPRDFSVFFSGTNFFPFFRKTMYLSNMQKNLHKCGVSPSGKALGFGSSIRRFESSLPSINIFLSLKNSKKSFK